MKTVDKILRFWRVAVALKYTPANMDNIFDIGCDDGYLFEKLATTTTRQDGIDPRLENSCSNGSLRIRGFFPSAAEKKVHKDYYSAVFALATFEHFSENELTQSAELITKMLKRGGRLILTVPHPFVDKILDVLLFLRLIDGQATEEHHGFRPEALLPIFEGRLKLVINKTFQFGLNNVFVFEKS